MLEPDPVVADVLLEPPLDAVSLDPLPADIVASSVPGSSDPAVVEVSVSLADVSTPVSVTPPDEALCASPVSPPELLAVSTAGIVVVPSELVDGDTTPVPLSSAGGPSSMGLSPQHASLAPGASQRKARQATSMSSLKSGAGEPQPQARAKPIVPKLLIPIVPFMPR